MLMGVCGAVHVILLPTLFQTVARDRMLGRVLSMYSGVTAAYPLGFIIGGALASALGNEVAIILGALGSTPVILLTVPALPCPAPPVSSDAAGRLRLRPAPVC